MSHFKPNQIWDFRRTTNTICFNHIDGNESCVVTITVKMTKDNAFDITYKNTYVGPNKQNAKKCHPLYSKSKYHKDDSMLEGLFAMANPATYQMIQCLMCDDGDKEIFETGCRPYSEYCGEMMRALCELEV